MAMNGSDVLILANTGTAETPVWTAVAEQTGLSMESDRNLIEVSSKNYDHAQFVYGRASDTLTLEGMYVPGDAGLKALRDSMKNKVPVKVRRSEGGTQIEEAEALIGALSLDFPDDDTSTVSIDMTLNTAFTAVA